MTTATATNIERVRTHRTNAGSLRKGDVIADGTAGYVVLHVTTNGSSKAVAARSVRHPGNVMAYLFRVTDTVTIIHPEDVGRELDR